MSCRRFVQLECEGCPSTYPEQPAADQNAGGLRAQAASVGWEVLRHTTGRDLCPRCRVLEINAAAGTGAP